MRYENMAIEIIKFLQKWGLWEGTLIFSDGNMYAYSFEKTDTYKGIPFVKFKENVDSTKYTTENGKNYSNPEHLFDMVFDGASYSLLNAEGYTVKGEDLSFEAWEEIFQRTDLLNNYTADNFDVYDAEDVLEKIVLNDFEFCNMVIFDDPKFCNMQDFDTWEKYLKFCGIDIDSRDKNSVDGYHVLSVDDIMPLWDMIADKAKTEIKKEYSDRLVLHEMRSYIVSQFNEIFERYGLRYDFGFSWSLTCYRK